MQGGHEKAGNLQDMTRLLAHEHVRCPCDRLERYVAAYLETFRREDGTIRLSLGPLPIHTLGFNLERPVVAHLELGPDPAGLNQVLHVSWEPDGGGPFPAFTGILTAEPLEESESDDSLLALDGIYRPPGGAPGKLFDEAIGYSIARGSARTLLDRLRDGAEAAFQREKTTTQ